MEEQFTEKFFSFLARSIDRVELPEADAAMLGESILELLKKRKVARDEGLFEEADEIRKELKGLGYEVRDETSRQKVYAN